MYRQELKTKAKEHTAQMADMYPNEIQYSSNNSIIYSDANKPVLKQTSDIPHIKVVNETTTDAIFNCVSGKVVALNFASYKNPGGQFVEGSSAQEEMLCHDSFLYNVLSSRLDYYAWNVNHLNRGLYTNRAIYTPNVFFFKGDLVKSVDVLTCAAPNNSLRYRYNAFSEVDNSKQLESRLHFIKLILENSDCDTAILGAFGCGVFKQDPYEVATLFKKEFSTSTLTHIIFAIPGGKNLEAFMKVFNE